MATKNTGEEQAAKAKFPATPIVVEISCPKNRQVLFPFTMQKLRGRWSLAKLAGRSTSSALSHMPDIPGMRMKLDCKSRTLTVWDPLGDEENEDLRERVLGIDKDVFGTQRKPHPTVVKEKLDDNDLKTILAWIAAAHDGKKLRNEGGGKIPSKEAVEAMPGRREINQFNSNPAAPKFEGDPDMRGQEGLRQTIAAQGG